LLVAEQTEGLRLALWYRTDLFTRGYAERFLGHIRTVLEEAVANPGLRVSAIPLLTPAERSALDSWNGTTVDGDAAATLVELFERQAARTPQALAVVGPHVSAPAGGIVVTTLPLTYGELNARANQLAHHLRSIGVGPDVPVGLMLGFSVDALIGLVGILKSGGAYMPLAVEAPAARLAQQIAESGATIVVTNGILADRLPRSVTAVATDRAADEALLATQPTNNPAVVATPASLAYILYTSGSTGVPKGVAVTHANAVHYARSVSRVLTGSRPGQAGDGFAALEGLRFGLVSTLAADLGNTSVLPSLLGGGALHVLAKDVTTDAARFAEYVAKNELDVLKITPNHLAALAFGRTGSELAAVLPRKWLVLGGEALRIDVARALASAGKARVLNHYGPTETTVGALTFEVSAETLAAAERMGAQTVPVGHPLANTHAYVADAAGNEQPVGIPGELLIAGAGVANGYFRRPELTSERFVEFRGERVYRTGDRVRRLPDGTIEFLGRADDQVKVRGFRVELGEIEQVLRSHPGVAEGVVVLRASEDGDASLVAYAVARPDGYAVSHSDRPTPEKLGEWFAAQLPEYMVPSSVVMLDLLPLTPNGKVDRARLPAPDAGGAQATDSFVAPRTATEESVAKIWREVLKRDRIGVTESFLDLGGHSLLAIRVLGRISKEIGVRLALRALFETPTVEKIAALIDEEQRERFADAALREALAAVENMSDAEVAQSLGAERAPTDVP
jgi:amino acid adenylation domain-containing protein